MSQMFSNVIVINKYAILKKLDFSISRKDIPKQLYYCIKNLNLPIFFSAIPVPRTTARSGSSAT